MLQFTQNVVEEARRFLTGEHRTVADVPAGLALQPRHEPRSQGPLLGSPVREGPAGGLRQGGSCPAESCRPGGEHVTAPGRDIQARSAETWSSWSRHPLGS